MSETVEATNAEMSRPMPPPVPSQQCVSPINPPLLKWPGGKREVLQYLLPMIPREYGRYYEPFLGGGALFFATGPARATLGDTNYDLVNCYEQVRDHPDRVIKHLRQMRNTETDYYAIRSMHPTNPFKRAARLIYLTNLSFNGIHRVNLRGEFNVPYGHKRHLDPCDESRIWQTGLALSGTELTIGDFGATVLSAEAGDLVYFDPPYTVAHGNNGFVKYNAKIFSWEDQRRLAQTAAELARRGCKVMVSNADHQSVRVLYEGAFECVVVRRPSRIAASATHRGLVTECVFHNLSQYLGDPEC